MTSSLPEPAVLRRRRRTPARVRWIRYGVAALLVVAVAVAAVVVVRQPTQPVYRTSVAGYYSVTQTLNGVVAVEPVDQAAVSFPASGTVSAVNVSVGETVAVGAVLATLDPTTLEQSLHQAQAKLATAQLTLNEAENGQSTSSAGTSGIVAAAAVTGNGAGAALVRRGSPAVLTAAALPSPTSSGAGAGGGSAQLHADEEAVIQAQHQVDMAMAAAAQAMGSAKQVCGPIIGSGQQGPGGTPAPSPSASPSASASPTPSGNGDASSCYEALSALLAAQQHVQAAQKTLAAASTTFDLHLSQQAASPSTTKTGGSFNRSSSSTPGTGTGSSAPRTSAAPSAADLIADEKAVDADAGMVSVAQQALGEATIVSPVAGRVVAVNLTAGTAVQADSSSENVMVASSGGYEAVTMVNVSSLPDVKLGDNATVTVDGAGQPLFGTVTGISLVGASESTGTAYPVVISLTESSSALRDGATGTDSIITNGASQTLAIPTSAVHDTNGTYSVTVLKGGAASTVRVTVGAVGATWTQIISGLSAGETVVIADLSRALPSSATSQSSTTTGRGTGGFAGAGGFRGGFAGGGAAGG